MTINIQNSLIIRKSKLVVLATQNTPTLAEANPIIDIDLGIYPLKAISIAILPDAIFDANYYYILYLDGIDIDNNNYSPPLSSSGEDYVQTGTTYNIPAGARFKICAYNAISTNTTNGTLNILAIFDRLDNKKV